MRCKKCGGKNTVIIEEEDTYPKKIHRVTYFCMDCKEEIEERVWVIRKDESGIKL
jgi:DNA-directed RNA polymerase subunit RPC12/RpoP